MKEVKQLENKKIDLSSIKVAIFDFDDTLAIHKDKDYLKHRNENEENLLNYYLNAYLNPESFYETIESCSICDSLQNLIKNFETKGVKMYCVSGMKFSFHLKAKQTFIDKYYGNDIEVISTSEQELKLKGIRVLAKLNNCKLNEILFVDDNLDVIALLEKNGVKAIHVDNIS